MVGSLFSWKSLLTKRNTREDCDMGQSDGTARQGWLADTDLAHGSLAQEHQLDAAAGLRSVARVGHVGGSDGLGREARAMEARGGEEEKETRRRRPGDVVVLCDFPLA